MGLFHLAVLLRPVRPRVAASAEAGVSFRV
jgi:hypothetical protein